MLIRIPLASILGGMLWGLENLLTYYADPISVILSGVFGVIVSGFLALVFAVLFLPVVLTRAWNVWRRMSFVPLILLGIGVICAFVARHSSMLLPGIDPEFGSMTVYSANPWFWLASWLLVIFSVVVMPFMGISSTTQWL